MSVGESFTLVPLSNFFVKRTELPNLNYLPIPPLTGGNFQGGNVTGGAFTWYQVFNFAGVPNLQGVELKTYVLVVRGFTTSTGLGVTSDIPFPQPFDDNSKIYKLFYAVLSTAKANYSFSINPTSTGIVVNFSVLGNDSQTPIVNDSFMILVWGF
jgi:hypothetical protein